MRTAAQSKVAGDFQIAHNLGALAWRSVFAARTLQRIIQLISRLELQVARETRAE